MQKTKTFKYLLPAVYHDGDVSFKKALDQLAFKGSLQNAYINDISYQGDSKYKLFLLINNLNPLFESLLAVIKEDRCFVDCYHSHGSYYMLVLEVFNTKAYDNFIESKYSEMYTIRYLTENFKIRNRFVPSYHILAKTEERRKQLIKDFDLPEDFDADEYDSLLDKEQETFNVNLIWEQHDTTTEN